MAVHTLASATGVKTLKELLTSRQGSIQTLLGQELDAKRLTNLALSVATRTPSLKNCTVESVCQSVMQAAELKLDLNPALGHAYLVPFNDTKAGTTLCTLLPGYKGLINVAYRGGHVADISSKVVMEGDLFEYEEGLRPILRHVPDLDKDRTDPGKARLFYSVVHLTTGGVIFEVMTLKEVKRIQTRSKSGSKGPWVTDWLAMARKCPIRKVLNYVPTSAELKKVLALENQDFDYGDYAGTPTIPIEAEFFDSEFDPIEDTGTTKSDRIAEQLAQDDDMP